MGPSAQPEKDQSPSRHQVWKMFDRIAPRYDLLNRLLSFGRDLSWRKKVARHLPPGSDLTVLDLATGTGDLLISVHQHSNRIARGLGMDMATGMLDLARRKIESRRLSSTLSVMVGDARRIPLGDGSCDAVTIAFGIRNVDPVEDALAEMFRVLSNRGRALILEFSLPDNRVVRWLYLLYFRYLLPPLGSIISGDRQAYRYLNRTVETFPYGLDFCRLMEKAGFKNVRAHRLTFGIATIYQGSRSGDAPDETRLTLHRKTETLTFEEAVDAMTDRIENLFSTPAAGHDTGAIVRIELPVAEQDPLGWLAHQTGLPAIYWAGRDGALEVAAVGAADLVTRAEGQSLAETVKEIEHRLKNADENARYYGGCRFNFDSAPSDDWRKFGAARFVLPRFEMIKTPQSVFLAANLITDEDRPDKQRILSELQGLRPAGDAPQDGFPSVVAREDIPDRAEWSRAVDLAYQAFDEGRFDKIVLARLTKLTLDSSLDPLLVADNLRRRAGNCFHFCFRFHPEQAFLGATPERLYRRVGSRIECDAIAGTRPRGNNADEDGKLGEELLGSAKDRREQQLVVDSLTDALRSLDDRNTDLAGPVELLKLSKVQHLVSRFEVTLKEGTRDSAVLAALHPTAAVGGLPRANVIDEISRIEPFDRGWYAGPIGWIGKDRSEFAVGIRSAMITQTTVNVYAGAGILSGSRAELEWNELESKISAVMEAISG